MADPLKLLKDIVGKHPASPFLFIGSGFSRRYLGLEDWASLLSRFCSPIGPFGYYSAKADGDLPLAATYMATDYNDWWWTAESTDESRKLFASEVRNQSDALKFEISNYMRDFSLSSARDTEFGGELAIFSEMFIDGIITTNWDLLLEELFPEYRVFVGQEELLFSHPQSIGEIYKIHGSAVFPKSMVLTHQDYNAFNAKNPYLAAKLVTIFVEHPIIFIGYSLTDPHIRTIITSVAQCLNQEKVAQFQENLIFVQRAAPGEDTVIEKTTIQSGAFSVTMMVVKVSDFSQVYRLLTTSKRKLPARILRFFKEQLYELVHVPMQNQDRLAVIDYDEIGSAEDVEFVVGVGVAQQQNAIIENTEAELKSQLARVGYLGISPDDLYEDVLRDVSDFSAEDLLEKTFVVFGKSSRTFIPVFRYLDAAGIKSTDSLEQSEFEGAKKVIRRLGKCQYFNHAYGVRYRQSFASLSTKEIIDKAVTANEALLMLPFQHRPAIDLQVLRNFLRKIDPAPLSEAEITPYRKMVCLYDRVRYGF